ncbi:MAG TPA: hypothetical protein VJ487_08740 [Alphaproteobacteria bacterium]|nr:hypothetical protein [Alphaproteobacteria bacterium]
MPLSDAEIRAFLEAKLAAPKSAQLRIALLDSAARDILQADAVDWEMRAVLRVEADRTTGAILSTL